MDRLPEPTTTADRPDTPDTPGPGADTEPPAPPRQRWRLTLARVAGAPALAGRELTQAWEAALDLADLPFTRVGRGPARIAFGAPLPAGMVAERELADVLLSERCPIWRVREEFAGAMPDGWRLVTVEDVWLGAPSLPGLVAAADYRIELGEVVPDSIPADSTTGPAAAVAAAAVALLGAARLSRQRTKGSGVVRYDLRPLVVDVGVADAGPPIVIRTRTLLHPTLGAGRPEEVVAALAEEAGIPLVVSSVVRERLVLVDELG